MDKSRTIFDKVWESHIVRQESDHPAVFFIDAHLVHEVTSPQAFNGLRQRQLQVTYPERTWATADHNVPTLDQDKPIRDKLSRHQVKTLVQNCHEFNLRLYGLGNPFQGIVHIIGPELGITQPGMTIVCGDSHTSTHGAFGAIAFGIGTSEVEQVLATQCVLQNKPKQMRITINGELDEGVSSKDIILYVISQISASGATGHFVEYAGSAITALSMEARMTVCNMSIEMGARGGLIAPDEVTFAYLKGRKFVPKDADWDKAVASWRTLPTDPGAHFDKEYVFNAADIGPMITYGTNPGMGIPITGVIPTLDHFSEEHHQHNFIKSLDYMGFRPGEEIQGKHVDHVFIGSCTNGRLEDLETVARLIKGKHKANHVTAWVVPGSQQVYKQAVALGLDKIFAEAGMPLRQPGCSACLGMNEDKVPVGSYCVSTSNRNFEGRQGPGARTMLASPLTAAACALKGYVVDPRELM